MVRGSTYLFHAYSYANRGAARQPITVRYHDASGAIVHQQTAESSNAQMMWSRVQLKTVAPKGAVRATVQIESQAAGTGTVWWDAVDHFRPIFYNGQFENTPSHSTDVPWWTVNANGGAVTTTTDQGLHVGTWTVASWNVPWRPTAMRIKSLFARPAGDVYTGASAAPASRSPSPTGRRRSSPSSRTTRTTPSSVR